MISILLFIIGCIFGFMLCALLASGKISELENEIFLVYSSRMAKEDELANDNQSDLYE